MAKIHSGYACKEKILKTQMLIGDQKPPFGFHLVVNVNEERFHLQHLTSGFANEFDTERVIKRIMTECVVYFCMLPTLLHCISKLTNTSSSSSPLQGLGLKHVAEPISSSIYDDVPLPSRVITQGSHRWTGIRHVIQVLTLSPSVVFNLLVQ